MSSELDREAGRTVRARPVRRRRIFVVVAACVFVGLGVGYILHPWELPIGGDVDLPDGMAKVRAPPGLRRETRNDGMLSFRSGRATRYGPSILTFTPAPGACPPTNAGSRWSWHGARLWLAERTETGTRSVSAFVDGHARVGDRCYSVSCQRHEEEDGLAVDPAGWCLGYLESLRAKP